jgi:hypothetical protein
MYFLDFRYTFSKKEAFKPEELKKLGAKREIKATGEVTLETEYNKLKKVTFLFSLLDQFFIPFFIKKDGH